MAAELSEFLSLHGRLLLQNRARFLQEFREAMPGRTRATNLLMTAFDAGVVTHFATPDAGGDALGMERLAQSIVDDTGTQIDLARWAVDVWQRVLAPHATGATPVTAAPAATSVAAPPANDITWDDEPAPVALAPVMSAVPAPSQAARASAPQMPPVAMPAPPPTASKLKRIILSLLAVLFVLAIVVFLMLAGVIPVHIPYQLLDWLAEHGIDLGSNSLDGPAPAHAHAIASMHARCLQCANPWQPLL